MRLKDLLKEAVDLSKSKKAINAESPCQFLSACGINYEKTFRDDDTGADFKMNNVEDTSNALRQLKKHKKIKKSFIIELEKNGGTTIQVYFK